MKKILYGVLIAIFIILGAKIFFIKSNAIYYKEKLEERTLVYINGNSAPRGRILDTNGKVLVDNIGVKTIYYNKVKDISSIEEISIAQKLASIITINEGTLEDLKNYWLIQNDNGKNLITTDEYKLLEERKITNADIESLKKERITEEMLADYDIIDKKAAYIYNLMNEGYIYTKKEILKGISEEEFAKVIESNIPGITGEYLGKEYIYMVIY